MAVVRSALWWSLGFLAIVLAACSGGDPEADADGALDGDVDGDPDLDGDLDSDEDADEDWVVDGDLDADVDVDLEADLEPQPAYVPEEIRAELIFSGPGRVTTPPTWNANLPKLVADERFFYAVHTHFTAEVATRFAAILRRSREGGGWVEVARVSFPHQPPGLVMDTGGRLHMIFDCLRPAGVDVTCFQGGAGTAGLGSRFYHLVFSARDEAGALRFDTYANHSEWPAHSNGYQGIGTTEEGLTFWSLADSSWGRVVQLMDADSSFASITTLVAGDGHSYLYPIMTGARSAPGRLLIYAGEFNPADGDNASYVASRAWVGDTSGFGELFSRAPAVVIPGETNAFPSDLAFDLDGTLLALSYLPDPATGDCTELLRFDDGLEAPPTILPVGCLGTYAKLQVSSAGVYYLLSSGFGAEFRLGLSEDRGEHWSWQEVPIVGLDPGLGDLRFYGATLLSPQAAPATHDPDRLRFFFSGDDSVSGSQHSYFGEALLSEE